MSAPNILSTTITAWPAAHARSREEASSRPVMHTARGRVAMPAARRARMRISLSAKNILALSLVLANTLVLGWYILSVNSYAGLGYQGYQLQQEVAELRQDQRSLQVQLAEQGSTARARENFAETSGFVPVGTPEFVVGGASGNVSMR